MVLIAVFFTFQALYSEKMFWIFYGPSTTLKSLVLDMFMQEGGIFGMPLGTIASFVVLFLIFGAFMEETGTGRTFTDLALGAFGSKVGGPAKAAVVCSAFFGMLSGSSCANVTTTGIEEAGNDHGRTAIIQSFKECFFICYLSFICAQKYEISSLF